MPSPVRHIRVPDDVWKSAADRAWSEHTTPSTIAVEALREYARSGRRVEVSSAPEADGDGEIAATERPAPPEPRKAAEPSRRKPVVIPEPVHAAEAPEPERPAWQPPFIEPPPPCRHPASLIRDDSTCGGCGQEVDS